MQQGIEKFVHDLTMAVHTLAGGADDPHLDNARLDEVVAATNDYVKQVQSIVHRKAS